MTTVLVILSVIALGVINIYSIYRWHRAEMRADYLDERSDILATALLRHMVAHKCPDPLKDVDSFMIHIDRATEDVQRKRERNHERVKN